MRLGKFALVIAAGLLAASPLLAQQPGGRGGRGGGFGGGGLTGMLSTNKQLQDELKMDADQVTKLTEAMTKAREANRDEFAKLRDASAEERTAILKKINETTEKAVETVLKPEQVKRLHQIENQQAGIGVFAKEDVQKTLKLTDAQKEKLDDINKELQKDLRDLGFGGGAGGAGGGGRGGRGGAGGGGFNPENFTKMQELRKEAMTSAKKALTDEQKDVLAKDVLGAPFELQFQVGGGGGGRGGQPGKILSTGAQDQLKLTDEQKKKVEELQKTIDEQLNKILSEDQQKQLKDMQQGGGGRGRGGRGGNNNPGKPNP
jgi:Spy/CpxP family protein refolding chaperone